MVQLISKSIQYLHNIETLDLKDTNATELPIEILKLHKLRHLLIYKHKDKLGNSIFDDIQSVTGSM